MKIEYRYDWNPNGKHWLVLDTNRDILERCFTKAAAYAFITLTERQNVAFS